MKIGEEMQSSKWWQKKSKEEESETHCMTTPNFQPDIHDGDVKPIAQPISSVVLIFIPPTPPLCFSKTALEQCRRRKIHISIVDFWPDGRKFKVVMQ
nr:hypothetical protein Itr_chr09CG12510 [Ipomoea trifida]